MNPVPVFYVDGTEYTLPCSLQRNVRKRESDNSGYMMNGKYNADYLGTYANYSVQIAIPLGGEDEYSNLYDLLAMPQSEYTFTMPYNQDFITFRGIISNIQDSYYGKYGDIGGNSVVVWRKISFEIQGIEPIIGVDEDENSN